MKKYLIVPIILIVLTLSYFKLSKQVNYYISKDNNVSKNNNKQILEKYNYVPGYSCKKIRVVDSNGIYEGTYNLEDYVAGVVTGETYILDDYVTFEAMSVIVRTYALYVTNNCTSSIINSEAHQVMSNQANVSDKIKKAVSKTKGQVLTYKGKLVKSEYDSFYMGNGFYCDSKYCYSTYNKVGNEKVKKHKIKVPASWVNDLSGGHGNGLSQYGAKYLSEQGYNYEQILKYFYADGVKISTIVKPNVDGLVLNNGFASRNTRPLRNNKYYYTKENANYLEGEANWYASSRANEILASIGSNKKIQYIKTENYCSLQGYNMSLDYNNPRVGSIISWGNHVAIIENVHDGMVDITEGYIGLGYYGEKFSKEYLRSDGLYYNAKTNAKDRKYNCENNKSGCFKRTNNIEISELKNRWGYDFKCYIYLVD